VGFESVQPLDLDRYDANRKTGSLILIDPLNNATVGAAMVRETVLATSGKAEPSFLEESLCTARNMAEARIQRRGHRPAILSLTWSRERAEELERTFHQRGFEVVLVNHTEIGSATRKTFYGTLMRLGVVVLCWTERPIRLKDTQLFDELANGFHFELGDSEDGSDVRAAIGLAERLRVPATSGPWEEA